MPATVQEDGRNAAETRLRGALSLQRLGCGGYADSADESEPDGKRSPMSLAIYARGTRPYSPPPLRYWGGASRGRAGNPFKIRANGPLSGTRLSVSSGGRGCSTSERNESSDDGGSSFTPCFPEGRRSGDVGGAGHKKPASLGKACELSPARNPDAAMLRTHVIPAKTGIHPPTGGLPAP